MGLLAGPKKGGPITREKKNSLQFSPFPALLPNRFLGELPAQLAPVDGMRPMVPTGPERLKILVIHQPLTNPKEGEMKLSRAHSSRNRIGMTCVEQIES